jgi:hypothetical protein
VADGTCLQRIRDDGKYTPEGGRCSAGTVDCGHRVVGYFESWNTACPIAKLNDMAPRLTHVNFGRLEGRGC